VDIRDQRNNNNNRVYRSVAIVRYLKACAEKARRQPIIAIETNINFIAGTIYSGPTSL